MARPFCRPELLRRPGRARHLGRLPDEHRAGASVRSESSHGSAACGLNKACVMHLTVWPESGLRHACNCSCLCCLFVCVVCLSVCRLCVLSVFLVCPVLSCPVLSSPVLTCPVLSCPVRSVFLSVRLSLLHKKAIIFILFKFKYLCIEIVSCFEYYL